MSLLLPRLYAIVDANTAEFYGHSVLDLAAAYLDGGARLLQLRYPSARTGDFLACADKIIARAVSYKAIVIINDRADIARMTGAAGVHVGQNDLSVDQARSIAGPAAIIGLSTHTLKQLDKAWACRVSYAAVGPVCETKTKKTGYSAIGPEFVLAAASRHPKLPIVGIGGVTLDRASNIIESGARSVAVVGDLVCHGDPISRVRSYVDALEK